MMLQYETLLSSACAATAEAERKIDTCPDGAPAEATGAPKANASLESYSHLLEMLADPSAFSHWEALEWVKKFRREHGLEP